MPNSSNSTHTIFLATLVMPTGQLSAGQTEALRAMLERSYEGEFSAEDWAHATGGLHVWVDSAAGPVCHAALVPRSLMVDGHARRVGYVEAVGTHPDFRRRGHASTVMRRINELIAQKFELGALSTGEHAFYERLGWQRWHGRSFVLAPQGLTRTPDDDDGLMVLPTTSTAPFDLSGDLIADWRSGDVW